MRIKDWQTIAVAVVALVFLALGNLWQMSEQLQAKNQLVAALRSQLAAASDQIAAHKVQEAQRLESDHAIYLRDLSGFIENGVVGLEEKATVYKALDHIDTSGAKKTEYIYELTGDSVAYGKSVILDKRTGKWLTLDAVQGETVYLVTAREGSGPQVVAYYTCQTSSSVCDLRWHNTDILTGK